jgi:hypothetical protein
MPDAGCGFKYPPKITHHASDVQRPASSIQKPASSIQHPETSIKHPETSIGNFKNQGGFIDGETII